MSAKDQTTSCHHIEPLLDDFLDDTLPAAERGRVENHLASCSACSEELAGLAAIVSEAQALSRDIEPAADLWPDISLRLSRRSKPASGASFWMRQAMAALFFMALGGVVSQVLLSSEKGVTAVRGSETGVEISKVSARNVDPRAEFALAEADYLRAKEALWAAVYQERDAVSDETREVVERNLQVIDEAILELRRALADDPGNPRLENLLLAQHRTEIDLLRRLTRVRTEA